MFEGNENQTSKFNSGLTGPVVRVVFSNIWIRNKKEQKDQFLSLQPGLSVEEIRPQIESLCPASCLSPAYSLQPESYMITVEPSK